MALTSRALFARKVAVRLDPGAGAGAAVDPAGVFLAEEKWGPDVVTWGAQFGRGRRFGGFEGFRKDLDCGKDGGGGKIGLAERARGEHDCRGCIVDDSVVGQI